MKPPPFDYHAPTTIPEALHLLATLDNARLLAGGQSLMPMLAMRFAFPDHLIDLNRIPALAGISQHGSTIHIGAMTRQRDLLDSPLIQRHLPLLAEALTQVGHRQTRNRGTIGGSLCHLDPAAELVAVAMALDATLHIAGPAGTRTLPMADFPEGYMTPSLAAGEMLTAVQIPIPPPTHGAAFIEFSRRHGDYAIVSAAAVLTLQAGQIATASITLGGVGPTPIRLQAAEAALLHQTPGAPLFAQAATHAETIEAMEDAQIPAWYRQSLAVTLTRRALTQAHLRLPLVVS